MKKTLLCVLALIAVAPVAVEAQEDARQQIRAMRAKSLALVNLLYEGRTCRMDDPMTDTTGVETVPPRLFCTYVLPGLRFQTREQLREVVVPSHIVDVFELRPGSGYELTFDGEWLEVYDRSDPSLVVIANINRRTGEIRAFPVGEWAAPSGN